MSRSILQQRSRPLTAEPLIGAAIALVLAVGVGLTITRLLLSPPAQEMRDLALYLMLTGASTLAAGWLAVALADGAFGLTLRTKLFIGSIAGTAVALINVFIVAQLMFVSTSHDLRLLIVLLIFSGVVTVCFSLWVASTITNGVSEATRGIRRLASGSYDVSLPVTGNDEVSYLIRDVNALAGQLFETVRQRAALDQERRGLTMAISHDLRTPVASIRAMLEALDDGIVDDRMEVARYYGALRREVVRLGRMIDDLFELSRLEAGAIDLRVRPVAVDEIAHDVVDAMQERARLRGVVLAVSADAAPAIAPVDGERIERALMNLVQNALDHTPAGGRIDVRVSSEHGHVDVVIADSGAGIGSDDLPHIWRAFYRADKSRHRANADGGAGLGLSIVQGIVEAHGGTVSATSSEGGGSTFTIRLPSRQ